VLVAGTQLSSIGSLALGSMRFWVVVVGGLLALAGVGAVLWSTIAALTAPAVGLHAVTGTNPPAGVEKALADPADEARRTAAQVADADVTHLDGLVGTLLDVTAYQALAEQWRRSRSTLVVGAAVAAIGISMVAWAANPPDGAAGTSVSPAVLTAPEPGTLRLTQQGRDALSTTLGSDCDVTVPLEVMVLAPTAIGPDVMVTADDCRPSRFVLVPAWGTVS